MAVEVADQAFEASYFHFLVVFSIPKNLFDKNFVFFIHYLTRLGLFKRSGRPFKPEPRNKRAKIKIVNF